MTSHADAYRFDASAASAPTCGARFQFFLSSNAVRYQAARQTPDGPYVAMNRQAVADFYRANPDCANDPSVWNDVAVISEPATLPQTTRTTSPSDVTIPALVRPQTQTTLTADPPASSPTPVDGYIVPKWVPWAAGGALALWGLVWWARRPRV